MSVRLRIAPDATPDALNDRLAAWDRERFGARMWERDPTIWFDPPRPELTDRLGWLDLPFTADADLEPLQALTSEARGRGLSEVVLLGMGGSSLAPEAFNSIFGSRPGYPRLTILDTTHPDAIGAVADRIEPSATLFLVASKSGPTTEAISRFRFVWDLVAAGVDGPGAHFVAITDPGTPLEALAADEGFRSVFTAPPDVGGRYSALSVFGLVPAALIGVDVGALLSGARSVAESCGPDVSPIENPALRLGATIAESARSGRDKLVFSAAEGLEALPDWAEQLVAESLGKEGKGIVPAVTGNSDLADGADRLGLKFGLGAEAGPDALSVSIDDRHEVGGLIFLLEMAVAAAGSALGVHPFDQPDVQVAKDMARSAMEGGAAALDVEESMLDDPDIEPRIGSLLDAVAGDGYVAIQAYLAPSDETDRSLEDLRRSIEHTTGAITTVGYGPRFLHSTGQLHKGGPPIGIFLQIVDHPKQQIDVPGAGYTFGQLIAAQSFGDQVALRERGRPVTMVCLGDAGPVDLPRLRTMTESHR